MAYLHQHKMTVNYLEALVLQHERYGFVVSMLDKIINDLHELNWQQAEALGFELGLQNGSEFCSGIRAGMLKALGAHNHQFQDEKGQILLSFAKKVNGETGQVHERDIEAMRHVGWSDQTVEDVIGLVVVFKTFSILANGFGYHALKEEVFEEMGKGTVHMKGYLPVFQSFVEAKQGSLS